MDVYSGMFLMGALYGGKYCCLCALPLLLPLPLPQLLAAAVVVILDESWWNIVGSEDRESTGGVKTGPMCTIFSLAGTVCSVTDC